ncbi:MAG: sigma-70 family RNA polymerase sigma factor [Verrucomicrobia subdivision 3 bacterium]|nr:sigma-70 family RNA polymerase sigma factor [Limisphaerales bacterium]
MFSLNPALNAIKLEDSTDLLSRVQQGDAEAFCDLCRVYDGRLLRQAMALCQDASLAEDLAQETLIAAWKSIRRYNGRCRFFTWLCSIMLHRYRKLLRRKRPAALTKETEDSLLNVADAAASPATLNEMKEQAAFLQKCLDNLPHKQRQIVYLRFYVENSLEEIALAVGCSVGTVKSRLFKALENLRKMRALKTLNVE